MSMNKIQEQEIIKYAFYEELEKYAGWETLVPKLLGAGSKIFNPTAFKAYSSGAKSAFGKGSKKGFEYLKGFANPEIIRDGAKFTTKKVSKKTAKNIAKNTGTIQKVVGGAAREFEFLGKGMSRSNTLTKNVGQLGKNVIDDVKRSITAAKYKSVDLTDIGKGKKFTKVTKNGEKYLKTNTPKFLDNKVTGKFFNKANDKFKRKIVGFTADGKPITRKRRLTQAGALAFTPAGMLATGVATGDTEEGVKDSLMWKVPAVAGTKMLFDTIHPGE